MDVSTRFYSLITLSLLLLASCGRNPQPTIPSPTAVAQATATATFTPTPIPPTQTPTNTPTATAVATVVTPTPHPPTATLPTPTPTNTPSPDLLLDDKSLLYIKNGTLYEWHINSDHTETWLENVDAPLLQGDMFVFQREKQTGNELHVLHLGSNTQTLITTINKRLVRNIRVSDNGRWLVLLENDGDYDSIVRVFEMGVVGGEVAVLGEQVFARSAENIYRFLSLRWSAENHLTWNDRHGVWRVNLNAYGSPQLLLQHRSTPRQVPDISGSSSESGSIRTVFQPTTWSPDGRYLILREQSGKSGWIQLFDTRSTSLIPIDTNGIISPGIYWLDDTHWIHHFGDTTILWRVENGQAVEVSTIRLGHIANSRSPQQLQIDHFKALYFCEDRHTLNILSRTSKAVRTIDTDACNFEHGQTPVWSDDQQAAVWIDRQDQRYYITTLSGTVLKTTLPSYRPGRSWVQWRTAKKAPIDPALVDQSILHVNDATLYRWEFARQTSTYLASNVDWTSLVVRNGLATFVRSGAHFDELVALDIESQMEIVLATNQDGYLDQRAALRSFHNNFFVSPNGHQIAFLQSKANDTSRVQIFEVGIVNGTLTIEAHHQFMRQSDAAWPYRDLAWSADGKLSWGDLDGIWVVDVAQSLPPENVLAQSGRTGLTGNAPSRSTYYPMQWSPDGRFLTVGETLYEGAFLYAFDTLTNSLEQIEGYVSQISKGNIWHGANRLFMLQERGVLVVGRDSAEAPFQHIDTFQLGKPIGNINASSTPQLNNTYLYFCEGDSTLNQLHKETLAVTVTQSPACTSDQFAQSPVWSPNRQFVAWNPLNPPHHDWRLSTPTGNSYPLPFASWVQWYRSQ